MNGPPLLALLMRRGFSIPRKEQTSITGVWQPRPRVCACGREQCPEEARHNFKAFQEACLKDPRWKDPAPFPVPQG